MNCQGCFKEVEEAGFCRKCLKDLFGGKKVSHQVPFNSPYKEDSELYRNLTKKLSISGVQVKYSMKLDGDKLVLTETGGQYILKPIPAGQFKDLEQAPANEHLTMQLAGQLFKIKVPPTGIVYFSDGTPAYLVKRFDVKPDGSKYQQEDFAQIAQVSEQTHGKNYKYDLSYEEIGSLIRQHIPMYSIEVEKFFRLVLFNYIFCNGDAHVKNFSAMRSDAGDYILTPAYDLLCTKIHSPAESDMALMLFKGRFSHAYNANGFYTRADFLEFGAVLGIKDTRVKKVLDELTVDRPETDNMIDSSFLGATSRKSYKQFYKDRRSRIVS